MYFKYFFAMTAVLLSNFTMADTVEGKVTRLWVNQKAWFALDSMPNYNDLEVTCNVSRRFVVDVSTDKGKAIYTAVLTAKSLGLDVNVVGNGNCDLHHDSEGVAYVSFE